MIFADAVRRQLCAPARPVRCKHYDYAYDRPLSWAKKRRKKKQFKQVLALCLNAFSACLVCKSCMI